MKSKYENEIFSCIFKRQKSEESGWIGGAIIMEAN